jgi:hypothetical protein
MAWRTGQIDPKATFRFDAMNGREAPESGLSRPSERVRSIEATLDLFVCLSAYRVAGQVAATEPLFHQDM